jgi:hypothetical protein
MFCSYSAFNLSQCGVYLGKQNAFVINWCLFDIYIPSLSCKIFSKLKKVVDDNVWRYQKWNFDTNNDKSCEKYDCQKFKGFFIQ